MQNKEVCTYMCIYIWTTTTLQEVLIPWTALWRKNLKGICVFCSSRYCSYTNCILCHQLLERTRVKLETLEHFVCSLSSLLDCLLLSVSRCKKCKSFSSFIWGLIYSSVPQCWNRHWCQESLPRLYLNNFCRCLWAWRCKWFYWGIACYFIFSPPFSPGSETPWIHVTAVKRSKIYCTVLPEL